MPANSVSPLARRVLSTGLRVVSVVSCGLMPTAIALGQAEATFESAAPTPAPTGAVAPAASGAVTTDPAAPAASPEATPRPAPSTRMYDKPREGDAEDSGPTYGQRRTLVLDEPQAKEDPKAYTLSAAGGAVWYDASQDESLCAVVTQIGPVTPNFRAQAGRQWFNQLQLQLDFGVSNQRIYECAEDGDISGTPLDLSFFTLGVGLAYRFDYLDEQPLVPYVAAGLVGSLIPIVSEAESEDSLAEWGLNHRMGSYLGGGLEILLDSFSPARAADLELSSGINDTFVVVDARYGWQGWYVKDSLLYEDASRFDGWQVTAGLKFDF